MKMRILFLFFVSILFISFAYGAIGDGSSNSFGSSSSGSSGLFPSTRSSTFSSFSSYSSVRASTYYPRAGFQSYYSGSDINTYWPILGDKVTCDSREDILLQVAPGGCQPAVVRSDLLAEQNVPVFCQIDALEINPLVDIKEINNIRFQGKYPKE